MRYFLLLASIGCFMMAIACASLYQASSPETTEHVQPPRKVSTDNEPGFVHR